MGTSRVSISKVQRGIPLADVFKLVRQPGKRARQKAAGHRKATSKAFWRSLAGQAGYLAPGSLRAGERERVIDALERILEGVYAHLPLKRARYGFDPLQQLTFLRARLAQVSDDGFHFEIADIITRLRDAHTRYAGPAVLHSMLAALPFLVERCVVRSKPTYIVTRVGTGLDRAFKEGVILEDWNGVPIDVAVQRYGEREVGGRPDSRRARALESFTLRSIRYERPPDEHWAVIGYRSANAKGEPVGRRREIRIDWRVVDPHLIKKDPEPSPRPVQWLSRNLSMDPASHTRRLAKMVLFTRGERRPGSPRAQRGLETKEIHARLPDTLKAMSVADGRGDPFGYLRIFAFDRDHTVFLPVLRELLPRMPDRGLVIDIRGNPGGYIWSAEIALQMFTPNQICPSKFSVLATPFTREISRVAGLGDDGLRQWASSLIAAVGNGEFYSQALPYTPTDLCNKIGQVYGGPVVLVADAMTYSAGDMFAAGFVDNSIGPFVCLDDATGGGGANVVSYADLRWGLKGSALALPPLPDGISLTFAYRRTTRTGPYEGIPIEDVGVPGTEKPYQMTRSDLLDGNRDLIAHCIGLLRRQPFTRMQVKLDKRSRSLSVATIGVDCLEMRTDGAMPSDVLRTRDGVTSLNFDKSARTIEITGFADGKSVQRRRIVINGRRPGVI
jgi:hypothetical protein